MEEIQETKTSGEFTTDIKFTEFIGGKGNINFISDKATIEAKYLTGLGFDDVVFKLTIFQNGTVDFEEVDTNETTSEQRKRFLEIISEKTQTNYRERKVIMELPFLSVETIKDKHVPLYLAVEHQKPIEKLGSILDDSNVDISNEAMENLNDLLNSWFEDEDFAKEIEEMINEENNQVLEDDVKEFIDEQIMKDHDIVNINIQDTFKKMKDDKVSELKDKKEKLEKEMFSVEYQLSTNKSKLDELRGEIDLIDSRLDDMSPKEEPLDIIFNLSENLNEKLIFDSDIEEKIRTKVSKVKGINLDNFMKLFIDSEYHLRLSTKNKTKFKEIEDFENLDKEILMKLSKLGFDITNDKITYFGDKPWAELVNSLVKSGFQQDGAYDKICNKPKKSTKK